jgi:hypothetical protein
MATSYQTGPVYYLTCPAGHEERVLLGNPKHEIMFQMASYSLLDENYWGAVSAFGTSIEEFWEFTLQCFAASKGIEPLPAPRVKRGRKKRFEEAWREVFKEEPLGTRQPPKLPVLSDEEYEIRNQVMHEAYIPSKGEAFAFGNLILARVSPAMQALRWTLDGAVGTASQAIIAEARARFHLDEPTAALGDATILLDNESMPQRTLVDYMPHLQDMDELFASIKAAQGR